MINLKVDGQDLLVAIFIVIKSILSLLNLRDHTTLLSTQYVYRLEAVQ